MSTKLTPIDQLIVRVLGAPWLQRGITNALGISRALAIAISTFAFGTLNAATENWLLQQGSSHYEYRAALLIQTIILSASFGAAFQVYGLIGTLGGLLAGIAAGSAGFYVYRIKSAPAAGA